MDLLRLHIYPTRLFIKYTSDCNLQLVLNFTKALYAAMHISVNPSMAHHQTDRQTEHKNTHIETYLQSWVNEQQDDWVD